MVINIKKNEHESKKKVFIKIGSKIEFRDFFTFRRFFDN